MEPTQENVVFEESKLASSENVRPGLLIRLGIFKNQKQVNIFLLVVSAVLITISVLIIMNADKIANPNSKVFNTPEQLKEFLKNQKNK